MDPGTRALIPRVAQGVLFLVPVGSGMRVLIAYDALPSSERALEEVLRRPWPEGTQVHLVTVVDRAYSPAQPPRDAIDSLLAEKYRSSLREETYHRIPLQYRSSFKSEGLRRTSVSMTRFSSRSLSKDGTHLRERVP